MLHLVASVCPTSHFKTSSGARLAKYSKRQLPPSSEQGKPITSPWTLYVSVISLADVVERLLIFDKGSSNILYVGARRTYGFRDLIAILAPDFGFNWENGRFWI